MHIHNAAMQNQSQLNLSLISISIVNIGVKLRSNFDKCMDTCRISGDLITCAVWKYTVQLTIRLEFIFSVLFSHTRTSNTTNGLANFQNSNINYNWRLALLTEWGSLCISTMFAPLKPCSSSCTPEGRQKSSWKSWRRTRKPLLAARSLPEGMLSLNTNRCHYTVL